jgi:hypothetical protein
MDDGKNRVNEAQLFDDAFFGHAPAPPVEPAAMEPSPPDRP